MYALTYASAKNVAILVVIGLVVIALLMVKILSGFSQKAILLLVVGGLVFAVWTQRQSLQQCADDVQTITDGRVVTCSFFGQDITIDPPPLPTVPTVPTVANQPGTTVA